MKVLLRSVLIARATDQPELFLRNQSALLESGLPFTSPEDTVLWRYVCSFVETHNHIPTLQSAREHFTQMGESSVVDVIDVLHNENPVTRGDFLVRLQARTAEHKARVTEEILRDARTIMSHGMEFKEGREKFTLKGPADALHYINQQSHRVTTPLSGGRLNGEVTASAELVKDRYLRVKHDPLAGIGAFTGIAQLDKTLYGAKRKEVWIHAGYTGCMKSTLLINWLYNQSVYYKNSSCVFTLEMPFDQYLNILYTIHAYHDKFRELRYSMGLQPRLDMSMGIPYKHIVRGTLEEHSERAEEFFLEYVIPDFTNPDNEYGKIHIETRDPTKPRYTLADLRSTAERIYSRDPFLVLAVDHMGLLDSRNAMANRTAALTEIAIEFKQMAQQFYKGEGTACVGLWQLSRDSYKSALKAKEKTGIPHYNSTALADAAEAERSADILTFSHVDDELRKTNKVFIQCTKSRDLEMPDPFYCQAIHDSKRLVTCLDPVLSLDQQSNQDSQEALDIQAALDAL